MPVQVLVTSVDPEKVKSVQVGDVVIHDVLGPREEALAVQLDEFLQAVLSQVERGLQRGGELTIEVTGALDMKASGEANIYFFKVGGGGGETNTLKVSFKTQVPPKTPGT